MNARNRMSAPPAGRPPLSRRALLDLLDHLEDQLCTDPCDHSHRHTMAHLGANGVDIAPTLRWLMSLGGECDCAVLEQVEQRAFD